MKISVIIPVYKTARTLDRCVKSVVSQEGAELEVILVDDGSPDDSPAMCDTWRKPTAASRWYTRPTAD